MQPIALLPLALVGLLASCAAWPDPAIPGEAAARAEGWPTLTPLGALLAQEQATAAYPPLPPASNRIAALNARAAGLRGQSVVDASTQATMRRGVDLRGLPAPALN